MTRNETGTAQAGDLAIHNILNMIRTRRTYDTRRDMQAQRIPPVDRLT